MTDWFEKNILAIETSTRTLKLALRFGGDRLVKSEEEVERSHGRVIIKKINELFGSADLEKRSLGAIVVSTGPGSFTGLRIGLAVAKGMAVGLEVPVVSVNLFELVAHRFRDRSGKISVIAPFKSDAFFLCSIEKGRFDLGQVEVVTEDNAAAKTAGRQLVGIGFDSVETTPAPDGLQDMEFIAFDAADMVNLGLEKLRASQIADLPSLEPLYLQKSQAEIKFEQRQRNRATGGDHSSGHRR